MQSDLTWSPYTKFHEAEKLRRLSLTLDLSTWVPVLTPAPGLREETSRGCVRFSKCGFQNQYENTLTRIQELCLQHYLQGKWFKEMSKGEGEDGPSPLVQYFFNLRVLFCFVLSFSFWYNKPIVSQFLLHSKFYIKLIHPPHSENLNSIRASSSL